MTLSSSPMPGVARNLVEADGVEQGGQPGQRRRRRRRRRTSRAAVPNAGQPRRLGVRSGRVDRAAGGEVAQRPRRTRANSPSAIADATTGYAACVRPNHWKSAAGPAPTRLRVAQRSASRRATIVASVTTIDGMPEEATKRAVDRAEQPRPAGTPRAPTSGIGSPAWRAGRRRRRRSRMRADRDVDLPARITSVIPSATISTGRVGEEQIAQVVAARRSRGAATASTSQSTQAATATDELAAIAGRA